ncbi:MAG: Asp23/Gls24 family envelope stress response protein [Tissierellia bacterium]|nr:Asp23/Gls24 family envelope stress response protein [Tissierellia bacterium]
MENKLVNELDRGNVEISNEVISIIASVEALSVEGVMNMRGSLTGDVVEMLGMKNQAKGIKTGIADDVVSIDVSLVVEYGKNIVEIAEKVQTKVKEAVMNMTGLEVAEVNVYIEDVAMPKKIKE